MINAPEAMTAVAKQLPQNGVTYREFITRVARLRGDSDDVIEKVIQEWVDDGGSENDIIKAGPNLAKMS